MVDETEGLEASTGAEHEATDETAPSSSVESETEADLLSVVQDAMQMSDEEPDSQSDEIETEETDEAPVDEELSEQEDDETYNDVPFNQHPRFKKLIDERNTYRTDAEQYGKIQSFLSENSVSANEAAQGLQIMALMKQDPKGALEALKPYVEQLSQATGMILPEDIQTRVDDGYLDEDAGRELSQTRAEAQRERGMREQMAQNQQDAQAAQTINSMASTVTDWERRTRQSDPDYELKQDEIDDRVKVLVAEKGRPQTASDALSMASQAYSEVNQRYASRTAARKPIKAASGGKLSGTPTPEPNSLMEAVQMALAQGSQ